MRIVLVNWAPLREGAARGGGVNGYCQAVALELVARGHEVVSLCGGTTYDAGPCRVQARDEWKGVRVFEVVNSPVLAPALAQFRDPVSEASSPEMEEHIARLMGELRPDVVHIHSLEGFSGGCVGAVRRGAPGARVLFSLHNYHTICPQVYLMQGHRRPCFSFDNGHACDGCIPSVDPAAEKWRLVAGSEQPAAFEWKKPGEQLASGGWRRAVKGILKRPLEAAGWREATPKGELTPPQRWTEAGLSIPAWRPLANDPTPEPPSARPPNDYALRRGAMIDALNACDSVLAVSDFVARKFRAMGVRGELVRTLHIGTRMRDTVARRPEAVLAPAPLDDGRPIRLAFTGYNNWYKGLPMLADSLELLTPEVLGRFHLTVLALGGESMEPQLRRIEPKLAGLTLRHGYQHDDLPWLLGGVDLGLVTSVWWDNGPQTVMEFLACGIPVLGANLGGIPDFVRDGENGLLFRGNDRWDLARRLAGIARAPGVLPRLRGAIRPPKGIAEHTSELEAVYGARVS